jgi:hypothetical protein
MYKGFDVKKITSLNMESFLKNIFIFMFIKFMYGDNSPFNLYRG